MIIKGVMLDIETTALSAKAIPWEIGFQKFEINVGASGPVYTIEPPDAVLLEVDVDCIDDFVIDHATIEWTDKVRGLDPAWQKARAYYYGGAAEIAGALSTEDLHTLLAIKCSGVDMVWCRNASFDFAIFKELFTYDGLELPWDFRKQCDIYTIEALMRIAFPNYTKPARMDRTAHTAAGDVEYQVQHLLSMLELLNIYHG